MAPEQVLGKQLDARSDLFSFGIVLHEMCTGVIPFKGDTSGAIFDGILHRPLVAPVRLNSAVPADLERIIDKALEKNRDLRYQHASDMRADFHRLRRGSDSHQTLHEGVGTLGSSVHDSSEPGEPRSARHKKRP